MQHEPTKPARRRAVPGRPGIYVHADSKGRERFEYCYADSDGRQRWRTVEGGVMAAVAGREDVRARMRRGERIAPTRITFAELADQWLKQAIGLRPGSLAWYESALRRHVTPKIGRLKVSDLTVDDMARLIADLQRDGLAPTTIRSVLVPLGRVLGHGVRRGLLPANPVKGLEKHERPKISRDEMRVLDASEIERLLQVAGDRYRALLATAVFTGLRSGELLGLRWSDVDFNASVVRVNHQIDRNGTVAPLKTKNARREVLLMPTLAKMLREHRIGSGFSQPHDYVFTRPDGRAMHPDVVRKYGLHPAVKSAGIDQPGKPRLRFHDLRHTYASLLIAQGVNVAFASRQLGHASVSTTLNVYTHLFDHAEHAATVIERLEGRFGGMLQPHDPVTASVGAAATVTALLPLS